MGVPILPPPPHLSPGASLMAFITLQQPMVIFKSHHGPGDVRELSRHQGGTGRCPSPSPAPPGPSLTSFPLVQPLSAATAWAGAKHSGLCLVHIPPALSPFLPILSPSLLPCPHPFCPIPFHFYPVPISPASSPSLLACPLPFPSCPLPSCPVPFSSYPVPIPSALSPPLLP